jgi:hypothetical protein
MMFQSVRGIWQDFENHKKFVAQAEQQLGITSQEGWYKVNMQGTFCCKTNKTADTINSHITKIAELRSLGGTNLMVDYYNSSLPKYGLS